MKSIFLRKIFGNYLTILIIILTVVAGFLIKVIPTAFAADLTLKEVGVSSSTSTVPVYSVTVNPGQQFRAWYRIANTSTSSITVGLGLSIRDPNGQVYDDPANDKTYNATVSSNGYWYSRQFLVPSNAPTGSYSVIFGLWSGMPGTSTLITRIEKPGWLTVSQTSPTPTPTAPTCSPTSQSVETGVAANLTATSGDGSYSWSAPGGTPSSGTGSSFSVSYSTTGTKTVTVTSGTGQTASCTVNVTTPPSPQIPEAPSNFTATPISTSQINLKWQDNSTNETGFKIERRTGSSTIWTQIAIVGTNITSYSNTGLMAATTYYYRIRAYNSYGNSAYVEASATTSFLSGTLSTFITASRTKVAYGNVFNIYIDVTNNTGGTISCLTAKLNIPYPFKSSDGKTSFSVNTLDNTSSKSFSFSIRAPYSTTYKNFNATISYAPTPQCASVTMVTQQTGNLTIYVERGKYITFSLSNVWQGNVNLYDNFGTWILSSSKVSTSSSGPTNIPVYMLTGTYKVNAVGTSKKGCNMSGNSSFTADKDKTVYITMTPINPLVPIGECI